jgi:hypothetical protein
VCAPAWGGATVHPPVTDLTGAPPRWTSGGRKSPVSPAGPYGGDASPDGNLHPGEAAVPNSSKRYRDAATTKGPWTAEEDLLLKKLVEKYSPSKW